MSWYVIYNSGGLAIVKFNITSSLPQHCNVICISINNNITHYYLSIYAVGAQGIPFNSQQFILHFFVLAERMMNAIKNNPVIVIR